MSVQHSELLVNDNWNTENESVRRSKLCAVHRRLLDHANSLSAGTRSSIVPTFFTHSLSRASKRQHSNHKREEEVTEEIFIFGKKVSNSSLAERRPSESHLCVKYNWRELRICSTSSFILCRISCQLSIRIFVDYFHIENKSLPVSGAGSCVRRNFFHLYERNVLAIYPWAAVMIYIFHAKMSGQRVQVLEVCREFLSLLFPPHCCRRFNRELTCMQTQSFDK